MIATVEGGQGEVLERRRKGEGGWGEERSDLEWSVDKDLLLRIKIINREREIRCRILEVEDEARGEMVSQGRRGGK